MEEYSPWGSTDDKAPSIMPARLPDSLPGLSLSSSPAVTSSAWGVDDVTDWGGWGSTQEYSPPPAATPIMTTPQVGWTPSFAPPTPELTHEIKSIPEASLEITPIEVEQEEEQSVDTVDTAPSWGAFGESPPLPPLNETVLPALEQHNDRTSGWGDQEWEPEELPPPLPSFGDAFSAQKSFPSQIDEEDAWGSGTTWRENSQATAFPSLNETSNEYPSRSIPAALIDSIKRQSEDLARDAMEHPEGSFDPNASPHEPDSVVQLVNSLSLPPFLPSTSKITNDTPLPMLFRQSSVIYHAFQSGLDSTAQKTAETLGSSSLQAQRTSRLSRFFGRAPPPTEETPCEESTPPEELKPAKISWWSRSTPAAPATTSPPALLPTVEETLQEAPAPVASSGFWGRFGRKEQTSSEAASSVRESLEVLQEVKPVPKAGDAILSENLDDFFGKKPIVQAAPVQVAAGSSRRTASIDFGGLDAFSSLSFRPTVLLTKPPIIPKVKDPFDLFGDETEERLESISAPLQPIQPVAPLNPAMGSLSLQTSAVASSSLSGPFSDDDDGFGDFLGPAPTSAKPTPKPTPIRITPILPIKSPPVTAIKPVIMRQNSPTPPTTKGRGFFIPPPPSALSPVHTGRSTNSNHSINISPPPSAGLTSPSGLMGAPIIPKPKPPQPPISTKQQGPLSNADLSFFEGL